MTLSLLYDLILRVIIIIVLTDAIIYYIMSARRITVTWQFMTLVIAVTLIPILINVWFVLWRYGVLNVR